MFCDSNSKQPWASTIQAQSRNVTAILYLSTLDPTRGRPKMPSRLIFLITVTLVLLTDTFTAQFLAFANTSIKLVVLLYIYKTPLHFPNKWAVLQRNRVE